MPSLFYYVCITVAHNHVYPHKSETCSALMQKSSHSLSPWLNELSLLLLVPWSDVLKFWLCCASARLLNIGSWIGFLFLFSAVLHCTMMSTLHSSKAVSNSHDQYARTDFQHYLLLLYREVYLQSSFMLLWTIRTEFVLFQAFIIVKSLWYYLSFLS